MTLTLVPCSCTCVVQPTRCIVVQRCIIIQHCVFIQGASRPTKVTLERLPFQHWIQENDRHAIDEVRIPCTNPRCAAAALHRLVFIVLRCSFCAVTMRVFERSLTPPQISKLYQTAHYTAQDYKGNGLEFFVDHVFPRSSDYNQHQAAYELNRTLGLLQDSGIQNMRNYERRYTSSMAETYPNVLNQAGTSDAAWSKPFEEDFAFRELPNGGRRSPRSHLFCHLVACNAAPYVPKLSHAEACSNSVASGDESDSLYGIDVSSDSDANEFLRDEGQWGYDLPAQLIRDLCETSLSSMSSRPRADILAELLSPAERADRIMDNMCPPDEYCDEMRSIVEEHFAGGGSSNSALLNARLGAIEDQYLAAEVEEEAIDDLQCALQRLREGINECDTDPAQSPNINSLCTAQCSNHQQVQEYC